MSKIVEMQCPICDQTTYTDLSLYPNQKFGLYEVCANEDCGGTFAFDVETVTVVTPFRIKHSS